MDRPCYCLDMWPMRALVITCLIFPPLHFFFYSSTDRSYVYGCWWSFRRGWRGWFYHLRVHRSLQTQKQKNSLSKLRFEVGIPEKETRLQNSFPEPSLFRLRGLFKWNSSELVMVGGSGGHHKPSVRAPRLTSIWQRSMDSLPKELTPCVSAQTGWTVYRPPISSGMGPTGCETEPSSVYTQECC